MNYIEKPIYHITHINNLLSIIEKNGLYCDAQISSMDPQSVAYPAIKERRRNIEVPFFPGSYLSDFVPFYFTYRSPMLYAIHTKCVPSCIDYSQDSIIYFVSKINNILEYSKDYFFTNGHPVEAVTNFFHDIADLDKIDWELIDSRSWANTPEDNDRKRRKQAEFLLKSFAPLALFDKIVVYDENTKREIESLFSSLQIPIEVIGSWYY
jgi:hypothetical protein